MSSAEKKFVKRIIDISICISLVLLSVKKGGFYHSDSFIFNVVMILLGILYIVFSILTRPKDDKSIAERKTISQYIKENIINILVMLFPIMYLLPVIFGKALNSSETIYEFIRCINLAVIFFVIRFSDNKRYYLNAIIATGILQAILGIDGLGLRFLNDFLHMTQSGYLPTYLDRLSGTIQYANTAALLFGVSAILVLDKYTKCKDKKLVKSGLFCALFVLSSSIILTGTRTVLIMIIPVILLYIIENRNSLKEILLTIITQVILILIYTTVMTQYLVVKSAYIYLVFAIFAAISYGVGYAITKIAFNKVSERILNFKLNVIAIILVLVVLVGYIVLAFNISKPLVVDDSTKQGKISREIYGLNKNVVNSIVINISENKVNSEYQISLYAENNKYVKEYITEFNNLQSLGNKINYEYTPKDDFLRLVIEFKCSKGKVSIEELKVNSNEVKLEYALLPSEYIFRVKNMLNGTDSVSSRITYMKDALKIVKTSPFVGVGGDGFNNMYKSVQTEKYTSSEVHNSFLQMYVETGIIGGTVFALAVIFSLFKSKKSTVKLAYILFIAHSIVDLNLSFMLMMGVFAILMACSLDKNSCEVNIN